MAQRVFASYRKVPQGMNGMVSYMRYDIVDYIEDVVGILNPPRGQKLLLRVSSIIFHFIQNLRDYFRIL